MRFRISSYKDNLLEIRGINTLWVLSGRPQTRRTNLVFKLCSKCKTAKPPSSDHV